MKKTIAFTAIGAVSALAILLAFASPAKEAEGKAEYARISPAEAQKRLADDSSIILLDVRTPEENKAVRIPGSLLIPDYELANRVLTEIPNKNAEIILYCRSGNRSRGAAAKLIALGYTRVYDLGGINAWPFATESGE